MTHQEHHNEHKKEYSDCQKGKHSGANNPSYGRRGSETYNAIPLVQLSKDGDFIREWECAASAQRELGIKRNNINNCCNNKPKYNTAGGYRWMYKKDWEALTSQ